jgi:hypothetical protein
MKAKFKMEDDFRLKADHTFERTMPLGGYNKDGSVREFDQEHRRAGSVARVVEIHETLVDWDEPLYKVDLGEFQVLLKEAQLLEMFEPI